MPATHLTFGFAAATAGIGAALRHNLRELLQAACCCVLLPPLVQQLQAQGVQLHVHAIAAPAPAQRGGPNAHDASHTHTGNGWQSLGPVRQGLKGFKQRQAHHDSVNMCSKLSMYSEHQE